jgi:hypothetical protein
MIGDEVVGAKNKSARADGQKYTYWHLFLTREFTVHTLVLSISWFSVGMIGFGLNFNIGSLPGSVYLNGLLMGEH